MSSLAAKLRRGLEVAKSVASQDAVLEYRTFAEEDSMSETAQWTVASTEYVKGVVSNEHRRGRGENGPTRTTVLTIDTKHVSARPDERVVVTIGSNVYRVTAVDDVQGALYRLELDGPTTAAAVVADTVGPRFTATDTAGGVSVFTWTATSNEGAHYRIRYRKPFQMWSTGNWVTTAYNTSHAGTSPGLDDGLYEVGIQGRDIAGNVGAWFDMPDVTVSGVPT